LNLAILRTERVYRFVVAWMVFDRKTVGKIEAMLDFLLQTNPVDFPGYETRGVSAVSNEHGYGV
jgi:hypothetical protein